MQLLCSSGSVPSLFFYLLITLLLLPASQSVRLCLLASELIFGCFSLLLKLIGADLAHVLRLDLSEWHVLHEQVERGSRGVYGGLPRPSAGGMSRLRPPSRGRARAI